MKKLNGSAKVWIIVAIVVVAVLGLGTWLVIDAQNKRIDFANYNTAEIIPAGDYNGNIADHVEGNPDAPVLIQEYANFQCSHCAAMHPLVKQTVADLGDQVGVIFRNVTWSSFPNSKAAAAAAEAAGLQGYWQEYADLLFDRQAEWSGATGTKRTELFNQYFEEVSDGAGDLEKFNNDIASDAVAQKIKFDLGASKEVGVEGTPAFYIEGQFVDMTNGGTITLENGEVVEYEGFSANSDLTKLIEKVVAAKTGTN